MLDLRDDGRVVAMTETGDVKQGLPIIDQSNLWARLNDAFANGRGSVRVLTISDEGRELGVDFKVSTERYEYHTQADANVLIGSSWVPPVELTQPKR